MAQEIKSVYGIVLTEEDKIRNSQNLFNYLESVVKAELLHPDQDYDNERTIKILREIAESHLDWLQRRKLTYLLFNNESL